MLRASRLSICVVVLSLALVLSACQAYPLFVTPVPTPVPQTEMNKEVVRRYTEEVWSQGKLDLIDEIIGDGYVFHDPLTPGVEGREAIKQLIAAYRVAYPDLHFTIEDLIAEGDWVVSRWTSSGTQLGELMGIPPTGIWGQSMGITLFRVVDGKIVEEWARWDSLGLLQQLGVVPAMGREDFGWSEPSTVTGDPGDPEANKAIVRRYTEEVWNAGNLDVLPELMSADVVHHEATMEHQLPRGLEGHKQAIRIYRAAFPDLRSVHQVEVAEGDKVAVLFQVTGTHKGELMGIPPTGRKVMFSGINIHRFADGKIVETWWAWDALGLLQQIGAIPLPAAAMKKIHEGFEEALNARDLDRWLSYWADDAVYDYVPLPTPIARKDVRKFFEEVFRGFPDFSSLPGRTFIAGNIIVMEHAVEGTHQGEWMGIPPTGKKFPTPHIDILEFEVDKLKRLTTYIDIAGILIRLGAMPAPELPELKPSFDLPDPEPTGLSPLEAQKEAMARWNAHDLARWAKMIRPDVDAFYGTIGVPMDREALVAVQELYFQAFPDVQGEITRMIDLGNGWVLTEAVFTGKNDGPFFGVPATGRPVKLRVAWLAQFDADGLITYFHVYFDQLSMLQQLGLVPGPTAGPPEAPPIPDYYVQDEITSPALEGNRLGDPATRPFLVYLPPSYETSPDKRYPVVYLLHGFLGDHTNFTFAGGAEVAVKALAGIDLGLDVGDIAKELMAAGEMQEMIIVMPNAMNAYGGSWYERSDLIGDYRSYIARDLVAYVDSKYRTIPDRASRGIAGHSMGGYGALSLAMEYPDVFGAVAALSPGDPNDLDVSPTLIEKFVAENPEKLGEPILVRTGEDLWNIFLGNFQTNEFYSLAAAWTPNLNNPPYYVDLPIRYPEKEVVPEVWEKWKEHDLVHQIARNGANLANTPIFIDQGVGKTVIMEEVPGIKQLLAALDAQGIPYTYDEFDGDHMTHLRYQVASALKFLSAHLKGEE